MASPEKKRQQVLELPYDKMFAAHLRSTYAVGNHDFTEAYKCQTVIIQSFLWAHKEENWALPVMYAVALDLQVFANNPGSWRSLKPGHTNRQRGRSSKESRKGEGRQPIRTDLFNNFCCTPHSLQVPASKARGESDLYPTQCQRGRALVSSLAWCLWRPAETR